MRDNKKDRPSPLCLILMAGYFYLFSRILVSDGAENASSLNLIAFTQIVPCINIFTNNSGNNKIAVGVQHFRATRLQLPQFPFYAKIASISPKMLLLKPFGCRCSYHAHIWNCVTAKLAASIINFDD